MRGATLLLLAALALGAQAFYDDTDVTVLTPDNFDEALGKGLWLVEVRPPTCLPSHSLPCLARPPPCGAELQAQRSNRVLSDCTSCGLLGARLGFGQGQQGREEPQPAACAPPHLPALGLQLFLEAAFTLRSRLRELASG